MKISEENNPTKNMDQLKLSDREEFVGLAVDGYESPLIRLAYAQLKDLEKSRLAVYETFMELCKENHEDIAANLENWLYETCRKYCKKAKSLEKKAKPADEVRWKKMAFAEEETIADDEKLMLLPVQHEAICKTVGEPIGPIGPIKTSSHSPKLKRKNAILIIAGIMLLGIIAISLIAASFLKEDESSDKLVEGNSVENSVEEIESTQITINSVNSGEAMMLPLSLTHKSFPEIKESIEKGNLPEARDVHIEEILNSFGLGMQGKAVAWQGCSVAAEILSSPWKPSARLVVIKLNSSRKNDVSMSLQYQPETGSILNQRIFGYREDETANNSGEIMMDVGSSIILILEVTSNSAALGKISWTVNGVKAPDLKLEGDPVKEPSDDARFAVLLCSYGLWLRNEERGMIDDSLVLALAREVITDDMEQNRYDFLKLIDQTVKLRQLERN